VSHSLHGFLYIAQVPVMSHRFRASPLPAASRRASRCLLREAVA